MEQSTEVNSKLVIFKRCMACLLLVVWANSVLVGEEFQVHLKSGSVLTIDSRDSMVDWTDVEPNGAMRKRSIPLTQIQRLVLSATPVSKQVMEIRGLLDQLGSDNYLEREHAEDRLSDAKVAGRFRSLIKAESESAKLEIKYRIARILGQLDEVSDGMPNEFDQLTLKDGTQLQGDAGKLVLGGEFRKQPLTFSRSEIQSLNPPAVPTDFEVDSGPVLIEAFQQYENNFYRPTQTTIDFESDPQGEPLARNTDVSDMFAHVGVLLSSEKPGFVGISGYGFKFPAPPKENSVCVFETSTASARRFKGVLQLRFCAPNQRSIVAGVHELGLFIARVDLPRDFILEAYNVEGQILATAESSDQKCVFTGVKSSEPIAFARVMSNPYLFGVTRLIDEDYAVDQLCFSPPVAVAGVRDSESQLVQMKNGDLLQGESILMSADETSIEVQELGKRIHVPLDDVKAIRFNTEPRFVSTSQRQWLAMLPDRSVIQVDPQRNLYSTLFGGWNIQPDQMAAIWLAKNKMRFPFESDFDAADSVMVFPTCRLLTSNLDLQENGYLWTDGKKVEQELWLENKGSDRDDELAEDPTPTIEAVNFESTSPELIPTLWLQAPQGRAPKTGLIRLDDGQQLVLNGSSGFAIQSIDKDSVTLTKGDRIESIKFENILSLDFPSQ